MPRFPARPFQDLPERLPDRATLAGHATGIEVDDLPGGFVVALPPTPTPAATDPHFGRTTDHTASVYATGPSGVLVRRVRVHFEAPDRDDAQRAGRLVGRLLHLHAQRFSRPAPFPRDADVADVWLMRDPAADPRMGGETRTHNVYVWDTRSARSAAEWARTLCHEWGHLTLPGARGFSAPEGDAAGYLGEALYLKFLRDQPGEARTDDFVRRPDLDRYHDRRNAPRAALFQAGGPTDRRLDRNDEGAMEYYVGAALACDDAFGSLLLGRALRGIDTEAPREMLASLRRAVMAEREVMVRLPAWVPFAPDRYVFAPKDGAGTLSMPPEPTMAPRPDRPVAFKTAGWRFLKPASGDLRAVTLRRLRG